MPRMVRGDRPPSTFAPTNAWTCCAVARLTILETPNGAQIVAVLSFSIERTACRGPEASTEAKKIGR